MKQQSNVTSRSRSTAQPSNRSELTGNLERQEVESIDQLRNTQLEMLIERANLDSVVAGRERSIEYTCLSSIVKPTRNDSKQVMEDHSQDDDLDDHDEPVPSDCVLSQDPFSEIETADERSALLRFLFEPIQSGESEDKATALRLSDDLIRELQNFKDRMQHRYNAIKRNLYNIRSHA